MELERQKILIDINDTFLKSSEEIIQDPLCLLHTDIRPYMCLRPTDNQHHSWSRIRRCHHAASDNIPSAVDHRTGADHHHTGPHADEEG